jgi:hypothetical protein
MKSSTTSDFWASYDALPPDIKVRARRAFALWLRNPRHPSLCFKKTGEIWTVRIARGVRALALLQGDTFYWFWIGPHDDYERMLKSLPGKR